MYNSLLDTFLQVADCGSFNRAAERLFISPTAVMKQINTLESHLELKLLDRKPSGVHLTRSGEIIYQDAKFMIDYSAKSIANAKAAAFSPDTTFCVGTSLLNPAKPFMDLWYKVNRFFPGYKLHLVPFDDNHEGIVSVISQLGEAFDFLVGVCDSKTWLSRCNMLPLGRYKKMIAVSREHRLAKSSCIDISDLYGETLMMVKKGDSGTNDFIRNDIEKNHPKIHIDDTPSFYDLSVFNRCAQTSNVLLTLECWTEVHPGLVTIPVSWDYSIAYGILYPLNPIADVQTFIDIIKRSMIEMSKMDVRGPE